MVKDTDFDAKTANDTSDMFSSTDLVPEDEELDSLKAKETNFDMFQDNEVKAWALPKDDEEESEIEAVEDKNALQEEKSEDQDTSKDLNSNTQPDISVAPSDSQSMFVDAQSLIAQVQPQTTPKEDDAQRPRWYIVHTYSGYEQRVQKTINEMKRTGQDQGLINEVIVPTEKVIEVSQSGKKRTITRKSYPGYVLVHMIMTDLSWHLVQSIPKVTGFIGGKNRPAPMRDSEAEHILSQMQANLDEPKAQFTCEVGDEVRVIDGPFAGQNAQVKEINQEKGKLTVSVSIFGRQTPMELDFSQVSRG